jgi:FkbM family methyltransferase
VKTESLFHTRSSLKSALQYGLQRTAGLVIARPASLHTLWEPALIERFFCHFGVDLVLDIGANAGQYARLLRHRVGYGGHIVSCEPTPGLAHGLREAAAADGLWHIEECAVSDKAGRAAFNLLGDSEFSSLDKPSDAGLVEFGSKMETVRCVDVRCRTVSDLVEEYASRYGSRAIYVKSDTQGGESRVIDGVELNIGRICGFQLELSFKALYENSVPFDQMIHRMQHLGFELNSIFPNNGGHFPQLIEMDAIFYRRSAAPLARVTLPAGRAH